MKHWIFAHQKQLSMGIGILLIILSIGWLFWDMQNSALSEEETRAAANVARMEARMSGSVSGIAQSAPDKPLFMDVYKEKQKEQLRYAIIFMMVAGLGFIGYSLIRKRE